MHLNLMQNYGFKTIYIPIPLPFPSQLASAEPLGWWRRSRWGPGGLYFGRLASVWRRLALARGTRVYSLFSAITNTLNTDHSVYIHTRADGSLRGRAHWLPSDRNLAVIDISERVLVFFHGPFFLGWCENMADMIPTARATLPKSVSGSALVPLRVHTVLRHAGTRSTWMRRRAVTLYICRQSVSSPVMYVMCSHLLLDRRRRIIQNWTKYSRFLDAECFDWKSQRPINRQFMCIWGRDALNMSLLIQFYENMLLFYEVEWNRKHMETGLQVLENINKRVQHYH